MKPEALINALEREDTEEIYNFVIQMLEHGDIMLLDACLRAISNTSVARHMAMFYEILEIQSQTLWADGVEFNLICFPLIVDLNRCEQDISAEKFSAALYKFLNPGEQLLIADGWAHAYDILSIHAFDYRCLLNEMKSLLKNENKFTFPSIFKYSPAQNSNDLGMVEFGVEENTRKFALRNILAIVATPASSSPGFLVRAVQDCLLPEEFEEMAHALTTAIVGLEAVLQAGPPLSSTADAVERMESAALEMCLEEAQERLGAKPVVHLLAEETGSKIVVADCNGWVLDEIVLAGFGLSHEDAKTIILQHASLVQHTFAQGLPLKEMCKYH